MEMESRLILVEELVSRPEVQAPFDFMRIPAETAMRLDLRQDLRARPVVYVADESHRLSSDLASADGGPTTKPIVWNFLSPSVSEVLNPLKMRPNSSTRCSTSLSVPYTGAVQNPRTSLRAISPGLRSA